MAFLEINKVSKKFGNYLANDDISLTVEKGKVFGLLGPNGAGKTTLIRIITRILMADSGQILFDGKEHQDSFTERIGYMPEERGLYKNMTIYDQLIYLARLKGMKAQAAKSAVDHWMQKFEIESWKAKKIDELSKGMSQKVQFIATILHNPDLIILDEPFSGLDPINSKLIEDEIHALTTEGKTIIFSTHRMEQVEQICDDIALINKGQNILSGKVAQLRNSFKKRIFALEFSGEKSPVDTASFSIVSREDNHAMLSSELHSNAIIKAIMEQGVEINSFREVLPSIQEIFIEQVNASNA
jgi:ABC-2 type transport system ATP-binding protein